MKKDEILKERLSNNLKRYRKENNLTQQQLAEKLNYSDKSISKWERKEGIPDIIILSRLADLYNISLNDFLTDDLKQIKKANNRKRNRIISLISFVGIWFVAVVIYVVFSLLGLDTLSLWKIFIYALPVSMVVLIVLSQIWGTKLQKFLSISIFIWSFVLALFFGFSNVKLWLLFVAAVPIQVIVILWSKLISGHKV